MKKKYESVFGEVEKHSYKREIKQVIDTIILILSILCFPFIIAGIIYGATSRSNVILTISIILIVLFVLSFLYVGFIVPIIIVKKGKVVIATAVKVAGSNVTYEYVDDKGDVRRSSGHTRYISKYTKGSLLDIKVYNGRSILNRY